jgi:hypothetical protein
MTPEEYEALSRLCEIDNRNQLLSFSGQHVSYLPGRAPRFSVCSSVRANRVTLDGEYTSTELMAIAKWMELHP